MRESDPRSEELAQELLELSASIQNSAEITQHTKDRMDNYLTEKSDMEVKFQKHLYIQGVITFACMNLKKLAKMKQLYGLKETFLHCLLIKMRENRWFKRKSVLGLVS